VYSWDTLPSGAPAEEFDDDTSRFQNRHGDHHFDQGEPRFLCPCFMRPRFPPFRSGNGLESGILFTLPFQQDRPAIRTAVGIKLDGRQVRWNSERRNLNFPHLDSGGKKIPLFLNFRFLLSLFFRVIPFQGSDVTTRKAGSKRTWKTFSLLDRLAAEKRRIPKPSG